MSDPSRDDGFVELSAQTATGGLTQQQDFDATILLRPRNAASIVDLAVEVLRGRLLAIVGICAAIWFPLRLVTPYFMEMFAELDQLATSDLGVGAAVAMTAGFFSFLAIQTLATMLSVAAVTLLAYGELVGRPLSAGEAGWGALRRVFGLIGVFFITTVGISVGAMSTIMVGFVIPVLLPFLFLLLIVVAVFLLWRLAVAPAALVLEDLGVFAALQRSWRLSSGGFLRWLAVMLLVSVLSTGFGGVVGIGDDATAKEWILGLGISPGAYRWLFLVISTLFSGISTALSAGVVTAYYLDLRMRRDGFDLNMRLERLRAQGDGSFA